MKSIRIVLLALSSVLFFAGCMAHETREERLALYQAHAGTPVKRIHYYNPIGWEEVDDEHIVLTMRPKEVWLMRLSGPCLDFDGGSPVLLVSSQAGYVSSGFDRVTVGGGLSCRIEEIRPVDAMALRAAGKAQSSGT
jgi:hypothetical protein